MTHLEFEALIDFEDIDAEEQLYFAANGRYFQRTMAQVPNISQAFLSIDAYESEQGHGYVVNLVYQDHYKSINYGPESWLGCDWQ